MMKRFIDSFLLDWKGSFTRKPLMLRGARQVGKTYAVRALGTTFDQFIEINLEKDATARAIFAKDLNSARIVRELEQYSGTKFQDGKTLLFIDEIQSVSQALLSLRYFYEDRPELHVIAAGSLLDFAIETVGFPVGRVNSLYMYPLSFLEFIAAVGKQHWIPMLIEGETLFEELHQEVLTYFGMYLAIGGLPEAVANWVAHESMRQVTQVHNELNSAYMQDFNKYAQRHQVKYLDQIYTHALEQLARKFFYARLGAYQKRELEPALMMLIKAGLLYQVHQSNGQGIPLGAGVRRDAFKVIFFDIGLTQALLHAQVTQWFINPLVMFTNKGELVEAAIGQELLAYSDPIIKASLSYWHKSAGSSQAEVDYLTHVHDKVIPIEAKAGSSARLKSMHQFFAGHPASPYGIRFWAGNKMEEPTIKSYPLYSVAHLAAQNSEPAKKALLRLSQ